MAKIKYNKGNIPKFFELMVHLHKEFPQAFESEGLLRAYAQQTWKSLGDKTCCPNCKASMQEYVFKLDQLDALLLLEMGKVVKHKLNKGFDFSNANKVKVQADLTGSYAVKSRTTQCRQLGLIAKVITVNKQGVQVHDREAGWLITKRGFQFLAGHEVPKEITVFRNKIVDRSEAVITINRVFSDPELKASADKEQSDWYDLGSLHKGELF